MDYIAALVVLFIFYLIFGRSKPKPKPSQSAAALSNIHMWAENSRSRIDFEVVGESHYQDNIRFLPMDEILIAHLIPEDNNPHDAHAVRVEIHHKTVGYLSAYDAESFRNKLKRKGLAGQTTACKASLTGGHMKAGKQMSYGVELNLSE